MTAALEAHAKAESKVKQLEEQYLLRLEQNRYEARRAQRQYDLSDPENRLVTSELERRWNVALEQIAESERELEKIRVENRPLDEEQALQLEHLGENFSQAWAHSEVSTESKNESFEPSSKRS